MKDFVEIQTNMHYKPLTFLIDTQADISIVKIGSISKYFPINNNDIIYLRGITPDGLPSLGKSTAEIHIQNELIPHEIHIVPDDFPIPSDGIIGKDFIQLHCCKIDYQSYTFSILYNNIELKIPIQMGPENGKIAVPPRSESFRMFTIQKFKNPCFIDRQELGPGIFTAPTIAHDDKPLIRILNTTTDF